MLVDGRIAQLIEEEKIVTIASLPRNREQDTELNDFTDAPQGRDQDRRRSGWRSADARERR